METKPFIGSSRIGSDTKSVRFKAAPEAERELRLGSCQCMLVLSSMQGNELNVTATLGDLAKLIVLVEPETPIHRFDVLTLVAGMWSTHCSSQAGLAKGVQELGNENKLTTGGWND